MDLSIFEQNNQELDTKILAITEDASAVLEELNGLVIKDAETNEAASAMLSTIKARMKRVKEVQEEFTTDLSSELKRRNALFTTQENVYKQAETALKLSIMRYMEEEEKKARAALEKQRREEAERQRKLLEEQEKLRKESEAAKSKEEQEVIEKKIEKVEQETVVQTVQPMAKPIQTVRTAVGTVSMKKIWTYEILDRDTLMATHPDFFEPSAKVINSFVQQIREEKEIDGLRIFQKSSIASRP